MNTIGIDLGGTNIKGVLLDESLQITTQLTLPGQTDERHWKDGVRECFNELKSKASGPVKAGLAAPGLPDPSNSKIVYMPGRLDGLENFDWSAFLGSQVKVINDAHAALVAEAKLGAAKGLKNVVMLTLGTGVGGGILIDGKLYQGAHQRAGSLGDISLNSESADIGLTGMPGSLEDAIGNDTIGKRTQGKFESTRALVEAHRGGDVSATGIWLASVHKLGVAIASLINVLSPEVVVIGGGIAQAGDDLFVPLQQVVDKHEMRPMGMATPIVKAKFSEYSGAIGAGCFGL